MSGERPDGVPEDWVNKPCANPGCPWTTWVPDVGDVIEGAVVLPLCSKDCLLPALHVTMKGERLARHMFLEHRVGLSPGQPNLREMHTKLHQWAAGERN